eukprot:1159945-Pelagomonas_calceolata.AAC.7
MPSLTTSPMPLMLAQKECGAHPITSSLHLERWAHAPGIGSERSSVCLKSCFSPLTLSTGPMPLVLALGGGLQGGSTRQGQAGRQGRGAAGREEELLLLWLLLLLLEQRRKVLLLLQLLGVELGGALRCEAAMATNATERGGGLGHGFQGRLSPCALG